MFSGSQLSDKQWLLASLAVATFIVVLVGIHVSGAYDRPWGRHLILWWCGGLLVVGAGLYLGMPLFVGVFVGVAVLAWFFGWNWPGQRFHGWRRHLARGVLFGLVVGPLFAVPAHRLPALARSLGQLARAPLTFVVGELLRSLPGLLSLGLAVGALSWALVPAVSSAAPPAAADRRPSRRRFWAGLLCALATLVGLNWYVAGIPDPLALATQPDAYLAGLGEDDVLRYLALSRPGAITGPQLPNGQTALHRVTTSALAAALIWMRPPPLWPMSQDDAPAAIE
jgi:hypothetical protein